MSHGAPVEGRPPEPTEPANRAGPEDLPTPAVPDHQLLRRIGRGSYGEVWLARSAMGMYRAVKVVYRKSFQNHRPFEREMSGIRKFEPISRSHEGFMDVLQVGTNEAEGYFYYVMEIGDDQDAGQKIDPERYSPNTLAKQISLRERLSFQECLQLGLALSQAVGELHKRGLVHRDIKPSNIIFVNGVPKLADIGLVADVNDAGSYVGTQGYIPPEGPGGPQGDVFSLGKVLYEASTGKDRQDFPELPADWDTFPEAEGYQELNEVVLQACRSEASKRYQSALDLHADLVVLENGKSVKRLRLLERRLSTLKRAASAAIVVLLLVAGIGREIYREWRTAVDSRQQQVGANIAYGNRAMEADDLLGALPYFAEALRRDQGNSRREEEHRLRFGAIHAQCPKLVQMWFAPTEVDDVRFSPDAQRVMTIERHGKAQVFDVATGAPVSPRFGQDATLWRGAFSPDGTQAATASEDKTACLWRVRDGARILTLAHPRAVLSAGFSPDGLRIVTSCVDGLARLWDARSGDLKLVLAGHTKGVIFSAFSPDGRRVVTTGRDNTARIWDAADGHQIGSPLEHPSWVGYAEFSLDGRELVTACFDHRARVWETAGGRQLFPDLNHDDGVNSVCVSPDGRMILTACLDHTARLWWASTHQPFAPNPILRHSDRVTHAIFSPDGHCIATTCVDGSVRIWDLAGQMVAPKATTHVFSEDKCRFATVRNERVRVWDTASGNAVGPAIRPGFPLREIKLNRNGRFLLAMSQEGSHAPSTSVHVFESETGRLVGLPVIIPNSYSGIAMSNDGQRLLAFAGARLQIWNLVTGMPPVQMTWADGTLQGAAFSPHGRAVAGWGTNDLVCVWDGSTGRQRFPPLHQGAPVSHVEFSPDSSLLVTCGADPGFNKCWAQVWDAASGRPIGARMMHSDGVLFATFSASGSRVATAGEDFAALIWETTTGRQLTPPLKHQDQVRTTAFCADGTALVTASADRTARVWSTATGEPLTPPLRHLASLVDARILRRTHRVVTSDRSGQAWIWDLPEDRRPADDLIRLSRLLTGGMVTPSGDFNSAKVEPLSAVWQRLRLKYPVDFTTSMQEIAAWHRFEAQESEHQQQWPAAAFHFEQLLLAQPGDQDATEQLDRARQHLRDQK